MTQELIPFVNSAGLPVIITSEGRKTTNRFLEFFTANIRNKNTRLSYARAVARLLLWCEAREVTLTQIEPMTVATYIEQHEGSKPTVSKGANSAPFSVPYAQLY